MHRSKVLPIAILALILLSSCQTPGQQETPIPLETAVVVGTVEIQVAGSDSFEPLLVGQDVGERDVLRTQGAASYAEIGDARSFLVVGPNASIRMTQVSTTADLTTVRVELLNGTVLVAAEHKLGEGYFEVTFPLGSALIQGSAMMVNTNVQSGLGNSMVTCTQGSATFNTAGGSQQLFTSQTMSVGMNGTVTNPIDTMDESIRERDPDAYAIMSDKYLKFFPTMWTTNTPRPSETPTPKKSATPTLKSTWTPFPTFETSTPFVFVAGPTLRPTVTTAPGFSGLTPEELANQGSYTFDITCQTYTSDCVCDSALSTPVMEIPITFDTTSVTMGSGDQQMRYEKANPNLYQIKQGSSIAQIDFLPDGWEFLLIKDGTVCTVQTFMRR